MLESDLMNHLDDIEAAAKKVGLTCRRQTVRSLTTIQILEPNGQWALFDPIRQGKDVSKLLFAAAKRTKLVDTEHNFRVNLIKGILNHDFPVPA